MSCSTLTGRSMPCRVKQPVGSGIRFVGWRACGGHLTLKDLEILQVSVFGIDVELDSSHWNIEIDTIEDLTESRTIFQRLSV